MLNNFELLVSIAITTYNHEKYIAQTIESVLMQITDFNYELVIGEDCSQDNTLSICEKYQKLHPNKIKLLKNTKNIGLRQNNIKVWTNCQGKYIAYCEGDDFWTDPNKLQKQIDILEKDSTLSGCFHQATMFYENSDKNRLFTPNNTPRRIDFKQNIERWVVATCSLVFVNFFRNKEYEIVKSQFLSDLIFYTDRPLMAFLTKIGDFYYLDENMGCWRQHETNMTKIGDLAEMYSAGGIAYSKMSKIFPENKIELSEQAIRWNLLACETAYRKNAFLTAFQYNIKSLLNIKSVLGLKDYLKCSLQVLRSKNIYE